MLSSLPERHRIFHRKGSSSQLVTQPMGRPGRSVGFKTPATAVGEHNAPPSDVCGSWGIGEERIARIKVMYCKECPENFYVFFLAAVVFFSVLVSCDGSEGNRFIAENQKEEKSEDTGIECALDFFFLPFFVIPKKQRNVLCFSCRAVSAASK